MLTVERAIYGYHLLNVIKSMRYVGLSVEARYRVRNFLVLWAKSH